MDLIYKRNVLVSKSSRLSFTNYNIITLIPQDLLQCQSPTGRLDEGATGGDDWTVATGNPSVVPEQAVQGQEADDPNETADAAREGEWWRDKVVE